MMHYRRYLPPPSKCIPAFLVLAALTNSRAADTPDTFNNSAVNLSIGSNFLLSILPLQAFTTDLQFSGTYTGGTTLTVAGAALNFGTLNDLNTTQSLVITNTSGLAGSLNLNTAANATAGSNASDLLYVKAGGTLTIQAGGGGLAVNLLTSGNVHNDGTLTISAPVGIAALTTTTFTGTGATNLTGPIGALLGSVNVATTGAGSVTLGSNNGYIGGTSITSGTLNASSIVVTGGVSSIGNAISDVTLGGTTTKGILNYTGNSATYTRGFAVNAGGGELDVATAGQTVTINTGNIVNLGGTFTVGGAGNAAIASQIGAGAGGLTKTGTGVLLLAGANLYSGPTTIDGGNVQISASADLGDASATNTLALAGGTLESVANSFGLGANRTITLTGAGGLQVDSGTLRVSGAISGTGTLTKSGSGTLTLSGVNSALNGTVQITAGTLALANAAALNANTAVSLGLGGILDLNGTPTETVANLSGTAGIVTNSSITPAVLTLNGSASASFGGTIADQMCPATILGLNVALSANATQTLSGSNRYTGLTTVASGTLQLGNTNALGNDGIVNTIGTGGTTVQAGGTVDLNAQANVNEVLTLNGTGANGNGALINSNTTAAASIGSGVSSINVSGNFGNLNGNTTVTIGAPSAGGTNATANAVLGVTAGSFNINGGTTVYLTAPTVTIGGGSGATAVANLTGGIVTSITITNPGCGFTSPPTISFSGGSVLLGGTNPTGVGVDGNFVLDGVQVTGNGSGYVSIPTVTVSSGAVVTTANLSAVTLASTASIGGAGNIAINPVVSGTGGLTKVGTGTVTLNAVETYSGPTSVSAGTLALGVNNALSTSSGVNITTGATLALGATSTTVNGNINLTNGNITGSGSLIAGGVNPAITVANGTIGASLGGVGATLTKNSDGSGTGGTVVLSGVNTYTGPTQVNAGTLEVDGSISPSSGVTVGGATALGLPILSGIGTIAGTVTVSAANGGAAGILNPGQAGAIGTLTVGNINFQGGSTLVMDLNGGAGDLLKVNQVANIASGTNLQLNAANLTLGDYTLVTAASGLNGNLLNIVGGLPSGYAIIQTATSIDLEHIADQVFATGSHPTVNIITGSSITVSATLDNTAPSGSQGLTINLSDNGSTGGVVSGFISSGGSDISPGGSTTVSATFTAGNVGTNETWSFKNTDNNAVPTTVSVTGPVNVFNHATPVLTITGGNNQSGFVGSTLTAPTATLSDTTGVLPVALDVAGLGNLTGTVGSGAVAPGGTNTYTGAALNTSTPGIGKTEVLSVLTGDQQTVAGANPLSTLTQTITYNIYNHATPTLTLTPGNVPAAFVGGSVGTVTATLADAGNVPAPLDVAGLTYLTGTTGSAVVPTNGTALYNVTGFDTSVAQLNKNLAVGLMAGDTQTINGANPLGLLTQNVVYNVYNHTTPTLTLTSGNNQSAFVNGTINPATLLLADNGSAPAPLDVGSLSNLTGTTGSGVIATGSTGTYTATGYDTTTAGIGKTLSTSLATGDQQTIPGANALQTETQSITYNVYTHATPTLAVTAGNNQSVFLNGTIATATLALSNPGANSVPVDVASLSNLTGATGSGVLGTGATQNYTATGFNTSTVGIGKTLSTGLLAGDMQSVAGANPLGALNQTLTYNVYNHATSSLTGGTFNLGITHVGYTAPVTSANSLTATNGAASDDRVNLQGSAPSAGNISVNSLTGIASGASGSISATLATGQGVGTINQALTYTFGDQSAIAGALSNVGTATLNVTGLVYSGQSAWTGNGTAAGTWGTLASNFGANWGTNQGTPGLDSGFTTTDTASFGTVAGQASQVVTLDGTNPSLNSLTFNATSTSYNIAQGSGGSISLNGGAGSAAINDFATGGTQTISAPTGLVTNTNINVAAGDTLTISGTMSGTGGITLTGDGLVVLTGNNTYTGTTIVDPGTLMINGMTAPQGNVVVANGATLSGSGSTGNVTVEGGGHINLQDGAIDRLTVSSLTIGDAANPSSISFDIGNGSALDGITDNGTLTFTGAGGTVINIGNVSGTPTLADGLFHLITSTGLAGSLADLTLSQTALDGKTLSLEINGNTLDLLIADLTNATTYSLGATTSNSRIIVGTGSTTVTSTLTNSGTADSVDYTGLNVSTNGGTPGAGTLPQNGGPVAPGQTSSGTRLLSAGNTTGVITVTPTVSTATNDTLGGNAILDGTTTATVDVVDNRVVTASAVALGRVLVGQAVSATTTLSTTGDDAHFTRVTVGTAGPDANGISATGGNGEIFNAANVTDTRNVGGTLTTAGNVSGTLTLTTTGEGLAGEALVNVTLSYSADAVNKRVVNVGAVTQLGELHTGSTVNLTTNPFTTTGSDDTTTEVQVAAGSGVADANGLALSGAATTFDGTVSSATRTLSGTIVNANGGVTNGTFNLAVTSLENGGAGLLGEGAYPSLGVSYSAMVYSGQGVYNAPGSGSWGTIQNPTNWTANGGAPGLDSNFTGTDSATFGNSIGTGTAAVTLDGDNPNLTNITFDNTMGGTYIIAPGNPGGGMITLDNGAGSATIANNDGNNTITAPVVLASNGSFSSGSGDTLTLNGPVSETGGAMSVTVSGPGTVDLGGANTYTGGTTVDSGTLQISGAGTLGATTGSLTMDGGTLDLGGTTQTTGTVTFHGPVIRIRSGTLIGSSYSDDAPSGTQTIDTTLGGTGSLTMDGGGTLALNGPNTFTGGTTINSGTVSVGNPTGLGNGNVTVTGGTLEAGNGNHIIDVGGNYTMTGGKLILNVAGNTPGVPGGYDILHLNGGTATLGGTLQIIVSGGYVPTGGTPLTFVQGGTTTGSFSSVTTGLGSQAISQTGPTTFVITQRLFATLANQNYTPNQLAVANDIDIAFANGAASPGFQILLSALNSQTAVGSSPNALADAFNQLTPMKFAEFTRSTIFNNASFSTQMFDSLQESQRSWTGDFLHHRDPVDSSELTVLDPSMDPGLAQVGSRLLAYSPAPLAHGLLSDSDDIVMGGVDMTTPAANVMENDRAFNIFVMGNVVLAQEFSQSDLAHADTTTGGVELGIDYLITPHFKVGVMFGFGHTDGTLDNLGSKATLDSYAPGIFASYADKGWYANTTASYGFNSYTEDRHVSFGPLSGVAHGAPSGSQVIGNLDGGYDFHSGHFTYGPTAGVQYTHYEVDSFSEDGSDPIDLQVGRENSNSLRSRIGGHVSYVIHTGKMTLTPHFDISWQHEFLDQSQGINSQFTSIGAGGFETRTPNPSRDSALIDAGLSAELNSHISLYFDYIAQAGQSNYFGQSVQAGIKIGF